MIEKIKNAKTKISEDVHAHPGKHIARVALATTLTAFAAGAAACVAVGSKLLESANGLHIS